MNELYVAAQPPRPATGAIRPSRSVLMGLAAGIVVLDQLTKAAIERFVPLHATLPVVAGLVNLTHVRNTGAAFGLLNAADFPFKPVVMTAIAAAALATIALYALRATDQGPLTRAGLTLIVAGAVGNLIDRARAGYVIDFVDLYWRHYHFWAFNVADAAITIGAVLLVVEMLGPRRNVPDTR